MRTYDYIVSFVVHGSGYTWTSVAAGMKFTGAREAIQTAQGIFDALTAGRGNFAFDYPLYVTHRAHLARIRDRRTTRVTSGDANSGFTVSIEKRN